ncbi:MAG: hypothetical protein M3Z04_01860, partial [Chloroflexota bacterium]|nr:hypothetical protein [Chloroflexota bacterium]
MRPIRSRRPARRGMLLLSLTVLASLLLAACGGTANPPPTAITGDESPTATPAPPTTLDNIRSAEQAGTVSRATAWLYRVERVLNPSALPSEVKGVDQPSLWSRLTGAGRTVRTAATAQVHQAVTALGQATRHWSEIPAELKAKFQPYRTRPSDPTSFWYAQFIAPSAARVPGLGAPTAAAATFVAVDAAHTPLRVWYLKSRSSSDAVLAKQLAAEIDSTGMWAKEQAVMLNHTPCSDAGLADNGGDGRLDVYLVPPGRGAARPDSGGDKQKMPAASSDYEIDGLTIPQDTDGSCPSRDFMMLNTDQDWNSLKTTMAHELFHTFQDSFVQTDDAYWWDEASAVWAQDLIYPTDDEEQNQLEAGNWANYDGVVGPLDLFDDNGLAQYGAYIWPFYLTHRPGGDPRLIGQFYEAGTSKSPIKVFHDTPGWNDRFKEFALWNWNKAPVEIYRDHGQPITALAQIAQPFSSKALSLDNNSDKVKVSLAASSMIYYELAQVDDGPGFVHTLRFDLAEVTAGAGAGVQAIVTTPSGKRVEDWSSLPSKTFCRDRPAERVTNVVLVVTNSTIETDTHLKG